MLRVYGCITGQHDLRLVVVAAMICLFACFTAFSLTERAQTAKGLVRNAWLAAAALITGCGVWATHFVAMLAFQPGLPVSYDVGLTALSVLIAILVSGVGYLIAFDRNRALMGARSSVSRSPRCILSERRRSSCRRRNPGTIHTSSRRC